MIFGNYWYHSNAFDIVADGPSDVLPQGLASLSGCSFEITGTIRKEGAWSMYLAGIYEAVEDLTSWRVEDNQTINNY